MNAASVGACVQWQMSFTSGMNTVDGLTGIICLLWVFVCGLRWYVTPPANTGQRRFFAIAAGFGAALFWVFGQMAFKAVFPPAASPAPIQSGEEIRIQGR